MTQTTIVKLGRVRDLLVEWEKVRACIVSGKLTGFQAVLRDAESQETVFVGGVYKHDTNLSVKATLRLSAARMLAEDTEDEDRPEFQVSRH